MLSISPPLQHRSPHFSCNLLFKSTMATVGEGSKKLQLYSYWRSSCSWRVRIALNLKGLDYEYKAINLLKDEQFSPDFLKINPLGCVPVLVDGDAVVSDSLAIILYLEDKFPQNPLLPQDLQKKAINFQAANIVCSSIQPLQNISVVKDIRDRFGPDEVVPWAQKHIKRGFVALEKLLKDYSGKYATGDEISLVDICLAPQIDGAVRRFQVDMNEFPLLKRVNEAYLELPAFQAAVPGNQPDADHSD